MNIIIFAMAAITVAILAVGLVVMLSGGDSEGAEDQSGGKSPTNFEKKSNKLMLLRVIAQGATIIMIIIAIIVAAIV